MCEICGGASDDDVLFGMHGHILKFGWTIEYVFGEPSWCPYGYTVGLTARLGSPELALAGASAEETSAVINALGRHIQEGAVVSDGDLVHCGDATCRLVEVDPQHLEDGTFGMWEFYYNRLCWEPPEHRVLEIVRLDRQPAFAPPPSAAR